MDILGLEGAIKKWYFVTKIVLTHCEKKWFSDREKLLKFEAEGREYANFLRSIKKIDSNSESSKQFFAF